MLRTEICKNVGNVQIGFVGSVNIYCLVCRTTLRTDHLKHVPLPGFPGMEGQCCEDAEAPC